MLHFVKVDLEREREREKKICLSYDLYFFENKVCVCVWLPLGFLYVIIKIYERNNKIILPGILKK